MGITAIIFDLGGVVLTNDWHYDCPEKFQEYATYFGISEEDMERGWQAVWPQFQVGKITEGEFWEGFLKTAGAKIIDVPHAKNLWRKYQRADSKMLALLERLKRHYTLAALPTISREWIDFKRETFHLDKYFTAIISSGYAGIAKPDLRIYQMVLAQLGVKAEACLFIDDQPQNLSAAEQVGMKTILFSDVESFKQQLVGLHITV